MENIEIIQLKPTDWKDYKDIRLKALQSEPEAYKHTFEVASTWPDSYWQERLGDTKRTFIVAKDGTMIIGMVGYAIDKMREDGVIIMEVYLDSTYRGKGIGKRLMQTALKNISHMSNIHNIKLWVSETQLVAKKMYESLGFKLKGVDEAVSKDLGHATFILEKNNLLT